MERPDCFTFPANATSIDLIATLTRGLRLAGFKTRLVERVISHTEVVTVVATRSRPSRKVRLAGFQNIG